MRRIERIEVSTSSDGHIEIRVGTYRHTDGALATMTHTVSSHRGEDISFLGEKLVNLGKLLQKIGMPDPAPVLAPKRSVAEGQEGY